MYIGLSQCNSVMVASYEREESWEDIFLFLVTKGNLILLFFTRGKFN